MPPVNSKSKKNGAEYENILANKCTVLDFEKYIQENKTLLLNDPLRDILLYPSDDVSSVVLPRRWRTVTTAVPDVRTASTCPLLTRQALLSYASSWNLVHFKYSSYSGTYLNLPRPIDSKLIEEVYDIDTETDTEHDAQTKVDIGTKEGYLLKGPEIGSDRIFSNLASKSFKKRYCSMVKEADGAYILEVYKDEKKTDTKLTIVMDFCSDVVKNAKRGRFCFELRMAGNKGYTFAAENEEELNDWLNVFNAALKKNQDQDNHQNDEIIDKDADISLTAEPPPATYGTLKGLEHSMNPLLMRYSRETDMSIAAARADCRTNIFTLPLRREPTPEPQLEPFKEHFGQRYLLKCDSLKFRLQAPIDGDKELLCQVEPYYTRLALYDARLGRKLTEDFHFDLNHPAVRDLVKEVECTKTLVENFSYDVKVDVKQIPEEWFRSKRQVVLSVNNPHPDLFLVVKIDKILQGHVSHVLEPYLKATKDPRLGLKVHKTVQAYANRIGNYRMPFAWAAKPLFRLYSNDLDTAPEFSAIYRQEPNKMSDDDLLKILSDYRKPEKLAKLTAIPGWLSIQIQQSNEQIQNCMTPSYAALKPFPLPPMAPLSLELANLSVDTEQPHAAFVHHLYVRPLSLNFESQKMFARARNIACTVELKENDTGEGNSLQAIYGRYGMTSQYRCSVLHHNASPSWSDEVKIRLPTTITTSHHLLFTFHHISCDIAKKNENSVETCIGYAWVPLLKNDKLIEEFVNLPIATHLPSGYLSIHPLGLGKGNTGPEVVWVESEKQLFRCQLVLESTVVTRDTPLHNLFAQVERLVRGGEPASSPGSAAATWHDVCAALKAAHATALADLIAFLPTILNQLFDLMTIERGYSHDMGYQVVKLIVHFVHMLHDYGRKDLLDSYVKYVFNCVEFKLHTMLTAPLHMFVDPNQQDFLLGNKFMQYSSFFFDIITKSMAQYLINTGRIKMSRHERFHTDLLDNIDKLVSTVEPSYILQQPVQTHVFNKNLALFLKSCLSFMDRGFIFRQIKKYLEKFKTCDPKALFDFKFTFLQTICAHEHYVPFNLPLQANKLAKDCDTDPAKLKLTDDFIMRHFLAGMLLKHTEQSLREAPQKRRAALGALRSLLAKHEHDDRYRSRQARARLAQLYAPWLTVVLENAHRLVTKNLASPILENGHDKVDGDITAILPLNNVQKEALSANSTPRRNRLTLHFDHTPVRNSSHFKEPPNLSNLAKDNANSMSQSSLESVSTMSGGDSLPRNAKIDMSEIGDQVNRFGVMSPEEVRDVLLCFLFVLKYLDEERLVEWWKTHSPAQQQSFFNVLEICAEQFQYVGRKKILSELKVTTPDCNGKPKPVKARTLPARMSPPDFSKEPPIIVEKNNTVNRENLVNTQINEEQEIAEHMVISAGCLATEVGLMIIDRACLFMKHLGPADGVAAKPYLKLLQYPQSETLYKHLFAALRAYINQFSETLFQGSGSLCGGVVRAIVRLMAARAGGVRREAAAALYLLMRANFSHGNGGCLTRVHLQVIIAVSKLLDSPNSLNCKRFQESLSFINCFATGDKVMKGMGLAGEVAELVRRVRTAVGARARLAGASADGAGSVQLAELQYALARSCRGSPRLRHAWLHTLAEHHVRHADHDEAMCCQLHIAALIAEYLKLRGNQSWGAEVFADISMNIPKDEIGMKIDEGMTDVHYNEQALLEQLTVCTEYADKAERYELLGPLYRLIVPMYERRRDYQALLACYQHLTKAYAKVIEVTNSGKRLLGRFYRVAFFGKAYFGEDEEGVEFIYKEPKLTSLSEISEKLHDFYEQKFGAGNVKMIMDSAPVNRDELDSKLAYIQVTWVRAAPEGAGAAPPGCEGSFERVHNVRRFVFETPFTRDGAARGPVHHQWLRLTHLTAESWFPYVKRRVAVVDTQVQERSPIEVALAEMEAQVAELTEIVNANTPDIKKLQLRLQGSVCAQVNAGPLAYANAFLDPDLSQMYPDDMVDKLKNVFKEFLTICHSALQLNARLISADQLTYHASILEQNYYRLSDALTGVLGPLSDILVNGHLSATVSGVQTDSSTA
ncbi:dedicator of cytokinesis protein 9 [Aricia agestis]|uniref:dedicator of cytokinesis protein 9 n=1 Tax=Aricia agestis TaxID=91739 RepID=UPI001C203B55|nr:dedicator of cytokinesis protein 9 [Aricia agestis]XP_041973653.1 dedicator of cytokinesis protein 9 [Aricia agestis]